jgi:hypothetical protein
MGAKQKNRRRSVVHELPRREWTDAEIDRMLDEILPLDDPKKLHLTQCRIAEQLDRGRILVAHSKAYGAGRSRKPVELALWAVASCHGRFRRYVPGKRLSRRGMRWTWMDREILWIAFGPEYDAAKAKKFKTDKLPDPPLVEFIAGVLGRTTDEVMSAVKKYIFSRPDSGFGL